MSISDNCTNVDNTTTCKIPFYKTEVSENKIPKYIQLFSCKLNNVLPQNDKDNKAAQIMSIINEDKNCAKGVDKFKMVQLIIKTATEFDIDPVVLTCIIRTESHFNSTIGKNGQGLMQLTKISIVDMFQRPKIYDKKLEQIKQKYKTPEALYEAIKQNPELNMQVGVILFKAKYNAAKGNLAKALENYNGSPSKRSYARNIMNMIQNYDALS